MAEEQQKQDDLVLSESVQSMTRMDYSIESPEERNELVKKIID